MTRARAGRAVRAVRAVRARRARLATLAAFIALLLVLGFTLPVYWVFLLSTVAISALPGGGKAVPGSLRCPTPCAPASARSGGPAHILPIRRASPISCIRSPSASSIPTGRHGSSIRSVRLASPATLRASTTPSARSASARSRAVRTGPKATSGCSAAISDRAFCFSTSECIPLIGMRDSTPRPTIACAIPIFATPIIALRSRCAANVRMPMWR